MPCGSWAWTMPGSPRRWWSSAISKPRRTSAPTIRRDEFVAKVWEWKAESGGQITGQLRRLGARWTGPTSASRWTKDLPGCAQGVRRALSRGLLYRDKRLVNWDPKFQSAISDLEVETREVEGQFWTLRYPLADGSGQITVATTRPETMLADMAVAVHPDDERYAGLVGQAAQTADHRAAGADHRRRACRSRTRIGRGQDHAGP